MLSTHLVTLKSTASERITTWKRNISTRHLASAGVILLVGLFVYLGAIGGPAIRLWDEAYYANLAKEMVRSGNWLIPHLDTPRPGAPEVWLEKPPLMFWLQSVAMLGFGVTEFAARLPSALAGIATALIAYQIGRKRFTWHAGLAAGMLLLIYPPVTTHYHSALTGDTDMLLTLFGTLFIWWLWRGRDRPRWLVPSAAAAGLAVLTKGFAAGIFLLVAVPLVVKNWRSYRTRWTIISAGIGLSVILPWFVYAAYRFPSELFSQMVVDQAVERGLRNSGDGIFWFMNFPYFQYLPQYIGPSDFWPLFILLLPGLAFLLIQAYIKPAAAERNLLLVWWTLSIPLGWAVLGGNHPHYLLPMVVPATIASGVVVDRVTRAIFNHLSDGVSRASLNGAYFIAGLAILIAVLAIHPYPPAVDQRDTAQRQIGTVFDNAPSDATVYIQADIDKFDTVMWFYIDQKMEYVTVSEIKNDESIRYAVVSQTTRAASDRNYTILSNPPGSNLIGIRFDTQLQ